MYKIDELFDLDCEHCAVNSFHDVVWQATGVHDLTPEQLREIFESLPDSIQAIAMTWGLSDTLFREYALEYLHENRN